MSLPVFFSIALFVSAALLFFVQPMFAKMVLPLLGGTPNVWNTCMVFFQAALLAGYAYAHAAPAWLGVRRQAAVHLLLLLLPFLVLPIAVAKDWVPPGDADPTLWLFTLLTISVGLPFFVVATTGPLLQKWFAETDHPAARDPYFLYSISNLGSMLALLGYPILLEPALTLGQQGWLWTLGYGLLVFLIAGCAVLLWRSSPTRAQTSGIRGQGSAENRREQNTEALPPFSSFAGALIRLRWIALAFVPSSLMLSVTTYLTTDIAAIPLLWVIPLALYLLTFILVFARKPPVPHALMVRLAPLVILLLTIIILSEANEPIWLLVPVHLMTFFIIAIVCHGELARLRPPARHLTEFYLWMSFGGVLGGLFNALVAPLVFTAVAEYPLVLVLACLLRPSSAIRGQGPEGRGRNRTRMDADSADNRGSFIRGLFLPRTLDIILPFLLAVVTAVLVLGLQTLDMKAFLQSLGMESYDTPLKMGLMFGVPGVICYTFLLRPIRFGLGIGALLLASGLHQSVYGSTVYRERSFFGVHKVAFDSKWNQYALVHGNTVHGWQSLDPKRRHDPLGYYHRSGPIGQVFAAFSGKDAKPHIGLAGLGAGSLAAYGEEGQHFTYYEIDPTVKKIASEYFTFVPDSRAHVDVVLGDARLTMKGAPDHRYGIIVMDAFSSDSIPLHLLTREALDLYKTKLADDGILAFHISNRYLDLEPILGDLAHDAHLLCWVQNDLELGPGDQADGKAPSRWVLMAREEKHLGQLARDRRWTPVRGRRGTKVWTDDFSNLFSVFKWN
jgi:hypothetical protein